MAHDDPTTQKPPPELSQKDLIWMLYKEMHALDTKVKNLTYIVLIALAGELGINALTRLSPTTITSLATITLSLLRSMFSG
jgi:hypothetical protein